MPSPIGHSLAGLVVHAVTARDAGELHDLRRACLLVGAATAADLDLLLTLVDGRNHHQGESHTLGFACLSGVATLLLAWLMRWRRPLALAGAATLAWLSHVLLDYLNVDTNPPIGIMALWPLSDEYFKSPWPLFLDIGRTLEWHTLWHDALAATWETVLLLPLLLVVWRLRQRKGA